MLVKNSDPLSTVNDVFNGIKINGNAVGEVMLYGRGAGKLPTASAVVSDIINILSGNGVSYTWKQAEVNEIIDFNNVVSKHYLRFDRKVDELENTCVVADAAYITSEMTEADAKALTDKLVKNGYQLISRIRILN